MNPSQKTIEEKFVCQRCNECCKKPGYVYLAKGEEDLIANCLNLEVRDFVNTCCDLIDRKRLVLKKLPDEVCIFLRPDGCSIHEVKPQQCRDFPFKWRTEKSFDYCVGLKKL